jgi:hypothetical protein
MVEGSTEVPHQMVRGRSGEIYSKTDLSTAAPRGFSTRLPSTSSGSEPVERRLARNDFSKEHIKIQIWVLAISVGFACESDGSCICENCSKILLYSSQITAKCYSVLLRKSFNGKIDLNRVEKLTGSRF